MENVVLRKDFMTKLNEITIQIKTLVNARDVLRTRYEQSEYHKLKEKNPHSVTPPTPEDEEIYRLLNAIQQLDKYIKELQDEQFVLLKEQD